MEFNSSTQLDESRTQIDAVVDVKRLLLCVHSLIK
jgi:hypothetical protein